MLKKYFENIKQLNIDDLNQDLIEKINEELTSNNIEYNKAFEEYEYSTENIDEFLSKYKLNFLNKIAKKDKKYIEILQSVPEDIIQNNFIISGKIIQNNILLLLKYRKDWSNQFFLRNLYDINFGHEIILKNYDFWENEFLVKYPFVKYYFKDYINNYFNRNSENISKKITEETLWNIRDVINWNRFPINKFTKFNNLYIKIKPFIICKRSFINSFKKENLTEELLQEYVEYVDFVNLLKIYKFKISSEFYNKNIDTIIKQDANKYYLLLNIDFRK